MFDIIIRDCVIVDGTENVGYRGSIAVEGDRLRVFVGNTAALNANRVINARYLVGVPGFIDPHTHSGLMNLVRPKNEPKVAQGITTEIVGLDGLGYVPLSEKNKKEMLRYNSGLDGYPDTDYGWNNITEYLQRFHHKISTNIAYLIPNGCLRLEVIGWDPRPATKSEVRAMQEMIRQGMNEGALRIIQRFAVPSKHVGKFR